jgi:1-acyl-sn-glycerol-3-phosphate acyltransferase
MGDRHDRHAWDGPDVAMFSINLFGMAKDFTLELLCRYFRVGVAGLEHIPRKGPAIIIANHSGFAGFDALVLSHVIHERTRREPRIMAHHGFFDWVVQARSLAMKLFLREAHVESGLNVLEQGHLLIVFPEAESGNFKSSLRRYELQRFHTGFFHLARQTGSPIIPAIVIGAEESNFCLGSFDLGKWHPHLRLPFPVNPVPLPAKWTIKVLDPVHIRAGESPRENAESIRNLMQKALATEVAARRFIYFPGF